jgi:hypothetical protein
MGWRRQRDRSGHAGLFAGVAFKVTSRPVIGCYRPPGLKTESAGSFTARFLPAKFRGVHSRRFPKGEIRAQWQGNVELSIETARRGHFLLHSIGSCGYVDNTQWLRHWQYLLLSQTQNSTP